MPADLRVGLWNSFQNWLFHPITGLDYSEQASHTYTYLRWPTDEVPYHEHDARDRLKKWFFAAEWHEVYDFVEWLLTLPGNARVARWQAEDTIALMRDFANALDAALVRDGSPYRLLRGELVPITSKPELDEVTAAYGSPFSGAREHVRQAAHLLSIKPHPDLRNSIKESVSAVESVLREATGLKADNMAPLLKAFENQYGALHPAFRDAVGKLYGWTSDESGLRHAIFGDVNVDHTDARFMLVTCSAFVNFLAQHVADNGVAGTRDSPR
jgi:hypothetical protein